MIAGKYDQLCPSKHEIPDGIIDEYSNDTAIICIRTNSGDIFEDVPEPLIPDGKFYECLYPEFLGADIIPSTFEG